MITDNKIKVDPETSDIFFNFGAVRANSIKEVETDKYMDALKLDAIDFLEVVTRDYTPDDLVNDFLQRI